MDEILLVRVLTRLVQVRLELGDECYQDAAHRALVAIGQAAVFAAESESLDLARGDNVVPFPRLSSWSEPGGECP